MPINSLNSLHEYQIQSEWDTWIFAPGSPNDTRPQPSTSALPRKIQRDLRVSMNCMWCFKVRILKSASLHKSKVAFPQQNENRVFNKSRPHLKVCVLPRANGCIHSSKLKSSGPRLSSIQGRVLPSIQVCVTSTKWELHLHFEHPSL